MNKKVYGSILLYLLVVLVVVAPVQPILSPIDYLSKPIRLLMHYRLCVVVFDRGVDIEYLSSRLGSYSVGDVNYSIALISYKFEIKWVKPRPRYFYMLREWFKRHYVDLGKPRWVREYEASTGHRLVVKWVELRSFYTYLLWLVKKITKPLGSVFNDYIVVIGDIDGVSRQYYSFSIEPGVWANNTLYLYGVKGFGGLDHMVFYDLTVVPRPHPSPWYPLHSYGRRVDYRSEPPIWSFNGSIEDYMIGIVEDHIRYHVVGETSLKPWYARRVYVDIRVVGFSNKRIVNDVLHRLNKSRIYELLESLDPWVNYTVVVRIVDASKSYRELYSLINRSSRVGGWIAIDYNELSKTLSRYTIREGLETNCSTYCNVVHYPVYILATDAPSFLTIDYRLNFTGYSLETHTAIAYPGYMYRIHRCGFAKVVVHEIGHKLGLTHPFRYNNSIRWLMDWIASVMSYDDNILAPHRDREPVSVYDRDRLVLSHIVALLGYIAMHSSYNFSNILSSVGSMVEENLLNKTLEYILAILSRETSGIARYGLETYSPLIAIVLVTTILVYGVYRIGLKK